MADELPPLTEGDGGVVEEQGLLSGLISEIIGSPLNMLLVGIITFLIYKIAKSRTQVRHSHAPPEPELPKMRRDFTVAELKDYDGSKEDGRILVAVNGSVYDVTRGKRFYGVGGPYAAFGGKDASRGLATFSVTASAKEIYDDLSDLSPVEMESVREWEMQFKDKYDFVGKLLRPGEQATQYSDEDEDATTESTAGQSKPSNESAEAEADKPKQN